MYIPGTGSVSVDKRLYIGKLIVGASKTFPVVVRVNKNAQSGLTAINVKISFDGYKSDGTVDNNQITSWDVPLRIYGRPLFQVTPSKTTFYKDTVDSVAFTGTLLASVKDLEATLSSSCLTVIGSSKQYLGDIDAKDEFSIIYDIKPNTEGACKTYLSLDYTDESGNSATNNLTFGLNVEAAGIDFKVVNITYGATGPGETVDLLVGLKNVGGASAEDTTISLDLSEPFVPVDTAEKYIGKVGSGETIYATFGLSIGWDATIQAYSIPMAVSYKVGGTSYSTEKNIGVDVTGQVVLEIINVEQRSGQIRVEVANIGTRTAEGVKATLKTPQVIMGNKTKTMHESTSGGNTNSGYQQSTNPLSMLSGRVSRGAGSTQSGDTETTTPQNLIEYKSDIKSTKSSTFTFDTSYSGPVELTLEYTGPSNKRVTKTESFTVGSGSSGSSASRTSSASSSTSWTTYLMYAAAVVVVGYFGLKIYRGRKAGQ
ncbi:MAG: hypothetical protein KKD39_06020 [Candidatus Altiarchaeota archaeon]|nr:hypothetical protein [Candidatus Altiarchaeota archaeon]